LALALEAAAAAAMTYADSSNHFCMMLLHGWLVVGGPKLAGPP
jgi:hypothetical protein